MRTRKIDWTASEHRLGTVSDADLAIELGCSKASVRLARSLRGIVSHQDKRATVPPDAIPLLGVEHDYVLADRFGVVVGAIRSERKARGIATAHQNGAPDTRGKRYNLDRRIDSFTSGERVAWTSHLTGVRYRLLVNELTPDAYLAMARQDCAYCGASPQPRIMAKRWPVSLNGIDRIDNSIGYVAGNCAPCCSTCNKLKGTLSGEQFRTHIRKMYVHQTLINARRPVEIETRN